MSAAAGITGTSITLPGAADSSFCAPPARGWYQEEGKPAVSLHEGSVVMIPANVKHWHGAKKNSWFSHLAMEVPGEDCSNEWCEPVSDEEYEKL